MNEKEKELEDSENNSVDPQQLELMAGPYQPWEQTDEFSYRSAEPTNKERRMSKRFRN